MRKIIVVAAIIVLIVGVSISFSRQEHRVGEVVADEWEVTPKTLKTLDEGNSSTYCAFIDRVRIKGEEYKHLNITAVQLKISASHPVRVIIGKFMPNELTEITGEFDWGITVFNNSASLFNEKVQINGKDVDFLEIKNEGTTSVSISGSIKTIASVIQIVYPYSSFGTLIVLVGFTLLIYGLKAKPRKRYVKKALKTS